MVDYIAISISMNFIIGILFVCFSRHKASFEKTANKKGIETAKKIFRNIKLCGYVLTISSGITGIILVLTR